MNGWVSRILPGGTAIHTIIQNILYSLFGTNLIVGPQIKRQIEVVKDRIPPEFKRRAMDDLGCGDGKITVKLQQIFDPRSLRGFDVNTSLVKRARNKGVRAEVMDLDKTAPKGELAVMWGVLHHLKNRESCIRRISNNYPMAFIREPIKDSAISGLEMGQPLEKEEIESLVGKYLPEAKLFYYEHCIFIFYVSPDYKYKVTDTTRA